MNNVDALKEIIRALGMNPEEILTKNALTKPLGTVIDRNQFQKTKSDS